MSGVWRSTNKPMNNELPRLYELLCWQALCLAKAKTGEESNIIIRIIPRQTQKAPIEEFP